MSLVPQQKGVEELKRVTADLAKRFETLRGRL